MGFPRRKYWSGLPFPSPGDLPDPGIEPVPPALAGRFFNIESLGKRGGTLLASIVQRSGILLNTPEGTEQPTQRIIQPRMPVVPGLGNSETELELHNLDYRL